MPCLVLRILVKGQWRIILRIGKILSKDTLYTTRNLLGGVGKKKLAQDSVKYGRQ